MSDRPQAWTPILETMIEGLKGQDLLDSPMEAAFRAIPRHVFLPEVDLERAYADEAIAIKRDADGTVLSSASQPGMMALMLKQLRLREGDNVLEIGAGSGYNAAIMQYIVGESGSVTSVEIDPQLAQEASANLQKVRLGAVVHIVNADGAMGYAPRASYDRIIVTAAIWDIPPAWIKQLKPGGLLVAPVWLESLQVSAAFQIQPDESLFSRNNIPCGFISMRGIVTGGVVQRRIRSSGLTLTAQDVSNIDTASVHLLLSEDMEQILLGVTLSDKEIWHGFLPFLTTQTPDGYQFVLYTINEEQQQAYGLEGAGFALLGRGSACFIPYNGHGQAWSFGASDAFFALNDLVLAWDQAGRPGSDELRLQVVSKAHDSGIRETGRVYPRLYHNLHAWLD